jgi:hypothetical protein
LLSRRRLLLLPNARLVLLLELLSGLVLPLLPLGGIALAHPRQFIFGNVAA